MKRFWSSDLKKIIGIKIYLTVNTTEIHSQMEDGLIYYSLYKDYWSATNEGKKSFFLQKVERDS